MTHLMHSVIVQLSNNVVALCQPLLPNFFNPLLQRKLLLALLYLHQMDLCSYYFDVWSHHSYQICLHYLHPNLIRLRVHGPIRQCRHRPYLGTLQLHHDCSRVLYIRSNICNLPELPYIYITIKYKIFIYLSYV